MNMNATVKIKISKAVFNHYVERLSSDPLAFPKAWPNQVGLNDVDDDMANLVMSDALLRANEEPKPSLAMAYQSLAGQIKKAMDTARVMPEVSHAKEGGGFITLRPQDITIGDQVRTELFHTPNARSDSGRCSGELCSCP